jgi:hypothetical protein
LTEQLDEQTTARLRRRNRRRPGGGRNLLIAVVIIALIWGAWAVLRPDPEAKDGEEVTLEAEKPANEEEIVTQRTFIAFGVEEAGGERQVTGALALLFDPARNQAGGLVFSPNTYVSTGSGFEAISDAYLENVRDLVGAISNVAGVKPEGHLVVPSGEFDRLVQNKDLAGLFTAGETSLKRDDAKLLAQSLAGISSDRVTVVDLPVKPIVLGEQTYYEPAADDLDRLVKALWGSAPRKEKSPIRVIVLNGNGVPGIGRKAADRLVGKGYKILDVRNAEHFDHEKTEIRLYNKAAEEVARELAKSLKVGRLVSQKMAQDVTDIVIVVGKDFN